MKDYKDRIKSHLETYLRPFLTQEEWEKDGDDIYERILNKLGGTERILKHKNASDIIYIGFTWEGTPQGYYYWHRLREKIYKRENS